MLESKHVIGLFILILAFSALFFTLGFKMGSQSDGKVLANPKNGFVDSQVTPRPLPGKHNNGVTSDSSPRPTSETEPRAENPGWDIREPENSAKPTSRLQAPSAPAVSASAPKSTPAAQAKTPSVIAQATRSKPNSPPLIPAGSYTLQVAALKNQADAMDLASRLQKKKFPSFVAPPQSDKFYRVQVGPYPDQKSADAAKKGLDAAGFKAIVKH